MTKKARQSFAKQVGDAIVVVSEDDLFEDDHPYVTKWPDMFGDLADLVKIHAAPPKKAAKVEQATAAPGETRDAKKK